MPAAHRDRTLYRFTGHEVQVAERRLLRHGEPVALGGRGFDLLVALVERAGSLVTKDELFALVWPKVVVDDSALQFQVSALRKLIGADAIATVSGRGYRFMREVERHGGEATGAAEPPPHNLPVAASSFIGRERHIERLLKALERARLVTLTGAGGCGKTRLALAVAAESLGSHPDGVWFVELAPLGSPALLPQTVLTTLTSGEPQGADSTGALVAHLAERRALLVLDNAEHLHGACAELCDTLLTRCPGVRLLVTSRQRLDVPGELAHRVPSLTLPDPDVPATVQSLADCESARLFTDRARLLRPHFAVTAENAPALAAVCTRLDGIPLALELAAGRMRGMSVEEIASRLDQRFGLLGGGRPAAVPRHRTLRASIDWSHDLLAPAEQALLARLSVFAGGCTLQAAEQVCTPEGEDPAEVVNRLASLADKNLLVIEDHDGALRYRLLETVRQYAAERLAETGDVARWKAGHLAHYAGVVDAAAPHINGMQPQRWFEQLHAERDNLRAALAAAAESPATAAAGVRMANTLARYWMVNGHASEARDQYAALLAMLPPDDPVTRASALNMAASLAGQQGDNATARAYLEEALPLYRADGTPRRIAAVLNNLAICADHDGDTALAQAHLEENIAILRGLGTTDGLPRSLHNLGDLLQRQGRLDEARAAMEESEALARANGDLFGASETLGMIALIDAQRGRHDEAMKAQVETLRIQHSVGSHRAIAYTFEGLAYSLSEKGDARRAAVLWGAAERVRGKLGAEMPKVHEVEHLARIARVRSESGDAAAFEAMWQRGAAMSLDEAVAYAMGVVD